MNNWNIDKSNYTETELEKFHQGEKLLRQFHELEEFCYKAELLAIEFKTVYINLNREIKLPTIFGNNPESDTYFLEDIQDLVKRYNEVLAQIEDPDWKLKVSIDFGG